MAWWRGGWQEPWRPAFPAPWAQDHRGKVALGLISGHQGQPCTAAQLPCTHRPGTAGFGFVVLTMWPAVRVLGNVTRCMPHASCATWAPCPYTAHTHDTPYAAGHSLLASHPPMTWPTDPCDTHTQPEQPGTREKTSLQHLLHPWCPRSGLGYLRVTCVGHRTPTLWDGVGSGV